MNSLGVRFEILLLAADSPKVERQPKTEATDSELDEMAQRLMGRNGV